MRNLILNNFWWKLLSLVLATLVWLVINGSQGKSDYAQTPVVTVSTRSFPTVPITLMTSVNSTNQYRLIPDIVSVEVSGKPEELEKLLTEQITAFVNLTKAPDEKQVREHIEIQVPRGFKIESFNPDVTIVERVTPSN